MLARSALHDLRRKTRRYLAFLDRFVQQIRVEPADRSEQEADAELLALLDGAVAALPLDERQLVERKYFLRQPVRQLAAELQTSEKAVESRLSRLRCKLKTAILARLKEESDDGT